MGRGIGGRGGVSVGLRGVVRGGRRGRGRRGLKSGTLGRWFVRSSCWEMGLGCVGGWGEGTAWVVR